MKVISILSQKGGAGKTTLSINLAVQAHLAGKSVAVFDMDPQESATVWGEARKETHGLEEPAILSVNERLLPRKLETAREHGADYVFIDTPPRAEPLMLAAARAADKILIPIRMSGLDSDTISKTCATLSLAQKPAWFIFNAIHAQRRQLALQWKKIIEEQHPEAGVCPVMLGHRVAMDDTGFLRQTPTEADPGSMAATEIRALWKWVA